MASPHVTAIGMVLNDVACLDTSAFVPGDLVYNNSGVWTKADADAVTTYAQGICMDYHDAAASGNTTFGHRISVCFEAFIEDLDAPFTAGTAYYLSSTPGAWTATRIVSTSTARLVQNVGVARTTSILHFKIDPPKEVSEFMPFVFGTTDIDGVAAVLDSGFIAGIPMDANNETVYGNIRVPEGAIGLAIAYLYCAEEAEASTSSLTLSVASVIHAADHDTVTGDTSESVAVHTLSTVDALLKVDVSAAFNATNIIRPGALLGVKCLDSAGGTDIVFAYGIDFIWRLV